MVNTTLSCCVWGLSNSLLRALLSNLLIFSRELYQMRSDGWEISTGNNECSRAQKPFEPRHFYEFFFKKRAFFLLQPSWPKGFYLNLTMSPMMTRSGIIRLFLTTQDIQVTKVHHKTQRGQVVLTRQINTASRAEGRAGVAGGGGRQRPNGIFPSLRLVIVAGVKGRILGANGGWLPGGRSPGACGLGLVHASPPRLFTLDTH